MNSKIDSHDRSLDPPPHPRITVLMCTLDGSAFVREQFDSILTQSLKSSEIHVSDDGSADQTRDILAQIAHAHPEANVQISEGPQEGYSANFFSLLARCPTNVDFVALDGRSVGHRMPAKISFPGGDCVKGDCEGRTQRLFLRPQTILHIDRGHEGMALSNMLIY